MLRWLILCAAAFALLACHDHSPSPPSSPAVAAGEGVAGIVAHTESAQRHVTNAVPHADSTGQVHLSAASDEHQAILTGAAKTRTALTAAQQQVSSLTNAIRDQQTLYRKLEERWYVVWGKRIEQALWIIGITWLVLGIGSVILGMGNPLSWTVKLGKEIVRLVPAMNIFAWVRDWINARRAAAGAKEA